MSSLTAKAPKLLFQIALVNVGSDILIAPNVNIDPIVLTICATPSTTSVTGVSTSLAALVHADSLL